LGPLANSIQGNKFGTAIESPTLEPPNIYVSPILILNIDTSLSMGRKFSINTIARQNYIDQFPELINIKAVASCNYLCDEVLRLRVSNLVHGKNAMSN